MKPMLCWLAGLVLCCTLWNGAAVRAFAEEPEQKAPAPIRTLPHQGRVQRALGPADTREVKAHTGSAAAAANAAVGAEAYATGKEVAFGSRSVDPDTVAAELAHEVRSDPRTKAKAQED